MSAACSDLSSPKMKMCGLRRRPRQIPKIQNKANVAANQGKQRHCAFWHALGGAIPLEHFSEEPVRSLPCRRGSLFSRCPDHEAQKRLTCIAERPARRLYQMNLPFYGNLRNPNRHQAALHNLLFHAHAW